MLAKFITKAISYLFPEFCLLCRNEELESIGVCFECFNRLNIINEPLCSRCGRLMPFDIQGGKTCIRCLTNKLYFDRARSLFVFDEKSKIMVYNLKYNDKTNVSKLVMRILFTKYSQEIEDYDCIIPVPMHRLKRLFRFYNQAQVLSQDLASISKKKIYTDVLVKCKWTKSQTKLKKRSREQNLKGSFSVAKPSKIIDKNIILVDDVITTSATIESCSKALKNSCAKKVFVLAMAMT